MEMVTLMERTGIMSHWLVINLIKGAFIDSTSGKRSSHGHPMSKPKQIAEKGAHMQNISLLFRWLTMLYGRNGYTKYSSNIGSRIAYMESAKYW